MELLILNQYLGKDYQQVLVSIVLKAKFIAFFLFIC